LVGLPFFEMPLVLNFYDVGSGRLLLGGVFHDVTATSTVREPGYFFSCSSWKFPLFSPVGRGFTPQVALLSPNFLSGFFFCFTVVPLTLRGVLLGSIDPFSLARTDCGPNCKSQHSLTPFFPSPDFHSLCIRRLRVRSGGNHPLFLFFSHLIDCVLDPTRLFFPFLDSAYWLVVSPPVVAVNVFCVSPPSAALLLGFGPR